MLFSEIQGAYYQAVAEILAEAGSAPITMKRIREIVEANAFAESAMVIEPKLESGQWPFLIPEGDRTYRSVLESKPVRPLMLDEKQWLKAILRDPRIRLFVDPDACEEMLSDVEALFEPSFFVYYDRYTDGDNYDDPHYRECFRTLLKAIHEKRYVGIRYTGSKGKKHEGAYLPWKIEYSEKDDKFRVVMISDRGEAQSINVSRISCCELGRAAGPEELVKPRVNTAQVELELIDERNTLVRAMLHFSDLEKETERLDDMRYKVRLTYRVEDETEILIRILAFGPTVKVVGPESFVRLIKERLHRQRMHLM